MSSISNVLAISTLVESIDLKGQPIILAAPIQLTGQLDILRLVAERQLLADQSEQSKAIQLGVDEAGRGPLLGSVNVAAAILPSGWSDLIENNPLLDTPLSTLTDSKKLSEKKRDMLYPLVQQYALGFIIAQIPAAVIDQLNILQATMLGMRLCVEGLLEVVASNIIGTDNIDTDSQANDKTQKLQIEALFDGNRCPDLDYIRLAKVGLAESAIDCQAWVKGDERHTSMAAASVLAKVSRDQVMYQLHKQHPEYGIAKHKGYPTKEHLQAIESYGVLAEHRRSFGPVAKKLAERN